MIWVETAACVLMLLTQLREQKCLQLEWPGECMERHVSGGGERHVAKFLTLVLMDNQ